VALGLARRAHEGHRRVRMTDFECIRHVIIRGRVQRIGYRAWTQSAASDLDLAGWVRNRRDGSVEAVFAGSNELVDAMLEACRKGPSGARVEAVDQRAADSAELDLRNPDEEFSVLETR